MVEKYLEWNKILAYIFNGHPPVVFVVVVVVIGCKCSLKQKFKTCLEIWSNQMGYSLFNVHRSLPNGVVCSETAVVLFPMTI